MLASYDWLKNHIDNQNLILIDSRPKVSYNYGHLKNSISLSVEHLIKVDQYGSNLVGDTEQISQTLGSLGIDETKTLIIVGEYMDPSAARIFWTLQYLGHEKIMFLEESFSQLQKLGAEFTRKPFKFSPTTFTVKINSEIRIQTDPLHEKLSNYTILDARSPQEFMYGHLPGSILVPFTEGIGTNGELFLPKEHLQRLFQQNNISDDKEIICYCMHGHRASSLFYQLKIAGFSKVKLYDGSFVEWHGRGLPLE